MTGVTFTRSSCYREVLRSCQTSQADYEDQTKKDLQATSQSTSAVTVKKARLMPCSTKEWCWPTTGHNSNSNASADTFEGLRNEADVASGVVLQQL